MAIYSRVLMHFKIAPKQNLPLRLCSTKRVPNKQSNLPEVVSQESKPSCKTLEQENRVTYELPKSTQVFERKTFLQLFGSDYNLAVNVVSAINAIQFTPYGLKKAWSDFNEHKLCLSQKYVPERAQFLGPELATAHFVCYRGGKVKFYDRKNWFLKHEDSDEVENLPRFFNSNYIVEAVDFSRMELVYEGIDNIRNMECPKSFSFESCPHIDDWCLDRIAGEYSHCLEHLNIKDCPKVTESGIACLSRLRKLKTLTLGGHPKAKNMELVCLMLEDILPDLSIQGIVYCDESLLLRDIK